MVGSAFLHRCALYARQALRQSFGEGTSKAACTWRWLVRAMLAVEAVTIKCVGEASQDHGGNLIELCRGSLNNGMALSNEAG